MFLVISNTCEMQIFRLTVPEVSRNKIWWVIFFRENKLTISSYEITKSFLLRIPADNADLREDIDW